MNMTENLTRKFLDGDGLPECFFLAWEVFSFLRIIFDELHISPNVLSVLVWGCLVCFVFVFALNMAFHLSGFPPSPLEWEETSDAQVC